MDIFYRRNPDLFRKSGTVVIYAADPGAWAVMEIFSQYLTAKNHKVRYLLDGWAEKHHAGSLPPESLLRKKDFMGGKEFENGLFIYGARKDFHLNYKILSKASSFGMKSLFIFDSWINLLVNFKAKHSGQLYLPSKIGVIDRYSLLRIRKILAVHTAPGYLGKIGIFGQPAVDKSVKEILGIPEALRHSLRMKYSCGKNTALFIIQTIRADFGRRFNPGYDEFKAALFFLENCWTPEMNVLIKPHPRQNPGELRNFFRENFPKNCRYRIVPGEKVENLIAISDSVYGMTSTALVASFMAGKKTISLQPDRNNFGLSISNPYLEKCLFK